MKRLLIAHTMIQAKHFAMSSLDLGGKVPTEFQLLLPGKWDGYNDPAQGMRSFEVQPAHIAAAVKYNNERKARSPKRDLVVDYEHATLKGGEAPAAGWIGNLVVRDNILFATDVRWTPKATKHIEEGEYRYISPVFAFDVADKVSGKLVPMAVFNAALTNEPFFDELQPIVSKDNSLNLFLFTSKEFFMDKIIAKLRSMLGLADGATEDEIISAMDLMMEKMKGAVAATANIASFQVLLDHINTLKQSVATITANYTSVLKELGLPETASVDEAKGLIIAGKGNVSNLQTVTARMQKLEQERLDEKFNLVIAKGIESGRITPGQKEDTNWLAAQRAWAASNMQTFEDYFTAKAPVIVPIGKIKVDDVHKSDGSLTETDLVIAKNMGVNVDALKKHNTVAQ
ncbi:MAG: hypothetical protein EPO24_04070 [Bacteroidetes bacterium]|nr:MAG: hypothetical protein EPO24_04070 [Bacteroidota bacterium]